MKKILLTGFLLLYILKGFCQNCNFLKIPYSPVSFNNLGFVATQYDSIRYINDNCYQICLIESSATTAKGFSFKLDSNQTVMVKQFNERSLQNCEVFKISQSEATGIFLKMNIIDSLAGFYYSYCTTSTSRYSYTLIINNPLKKTIQFTSSNLDMNSVLNLNMDSKILLDFFYVLKKYFPTTDL